MFNNGFNYYPYYKSAGLLSTLKSKIDLGTILTNAQKTLNVVNQTIPLIYQVKPIINNAKTVFKIMGAVKDESFNQKTPPKPPTTKTSTTAETSKNSNNDISINKPNFFL